MKTMSMSENERCAKLKKEHPEWYHATDYHWLDPGPHDFWKEAFRGCDYNPNKGQFMLFKD